MGDFCIRFAAGDISEARWLRLICFERSKGGYTVAQVRDSPVARVDPSTSFAV
jgi:hypothetical protein